MRYLRRLAAAAPDRQFAESAAPRQPRVWQLTSESPAGYRAARMLAARLGLSTAPILVAAFSVALASITVSGERAAFHLVVNNRFRPGFAGSVSPVMGSCPCVIEVTGAPFEDVARRSWQAALGAYKHAYYDWAGKCEAFEAIAAERGSAPDWDVVFNDRRIGSRELADSISGDMAASDAGGSLAELPPLRDEIPRTTLTWGEPDDMPEQKVFLSICDVPGTLCCELRADTRFVSPADMAVLLKRIESVLVDEAEAVVLTGTRP